MASTINILEYAKKHRCDIIFTSSSSIYGNGLNLNENAPFNPLSLYAVCKLNEEQYANFYYKKYGLNVNILRYTNCYGDTTYIENKCYPGKKDVIRMFMEKAIMGLSLPIIKGQSRDFIFIDDVVDATNEIMKKDNFNIFNIGTGVETKIEELPNIISKIFNKKVLTKVIPPRTIDNLYQRSLNIDKISSFWKPKYTLEEGLKLYAERI